MKRRDFDTHISTGSFKELFINLMGWNQVYGQLNLPPIEVDKTSFFIHNIAERNGFQILTCNVTAMPTSAICKKIDIKLRRIAFDYICIFISDKTSHNLWVAPIKKNGKREIVTIEYETAAQANFLFSKIDDLSFGIDEQTTITDVKERIQMAFALNSEKVTKSFYSGFKSLMKMFTSKISGLLDNVPIEVNTWKQWYASVMLNRLMFCYFIQKKGFLNNDRDYLKNKLEWVRVEQGANRFYETFYKGFLTHLFHDGLNRPTHDIEFQRIYGRIPFINGGLFGLHLIESSFPQLNIEDSAFQEIFSFFDTWNWHLDTRLESEQKDINPDVLGYIFEQYVNDKAEMGAFYTQEDITEHIAKNCILPYVLKNLLIEEFSLNNGFACKVLRNNPLKYIYESVKHGYSASWKDEIPDDISIGLNIQDSNLVKCRQKWSEKASPKFGLKKESWRDAIERFKQCDGIIHAIQENQVVSVDDFITHNLDIRTFALDLIVAADEPNFIKKYFNILNDVKVLDPACGSGAFLFAALNILEPLYEELLASMTRFQESGISLFDEYSPIISQYKKTPQFSILTRIAMQNLYGVDIMREAVETAKLRLFLKMVSTMEVNSRDNNMGLCPLPDLDFNICSGNTLTGVSSVLEVSTYKSKLDQLENYQKEYNELNLLNHDNIDRISELKSKMNYILYEIEKSLSNQNDDVSELDVVISNKRPLHWPVRFYSVFKRHNGFDVIIGNPPYRENNKLTYSVENYVTYPCGNVYTCMLERSWNLSRKDSFVGMIVQLPIVCTDRMAQAQELLMEKNCWLYNFDDRPGKLFENLQHIRVTIIITTGEGGKVYSSKYNRWYSETRPVLFNNLTCASAVCLKGYNSIPKVGNALMKSILYKLEGHQRIEAISNSGHSTLFYHNAPLYFTRGTNFMPFFSNNRGNSVSSSVKPMSFPTDEIRDICCALLNSTLFYIWYVIFSDCRHLNVREINQFPLGINSMTQQCRDSLVCLCQELMNDLNKNKIRKDTNGDRNGRVIYDEFKPKPSKPFFDKIDMILASHYGFTNEELDFILNYDVKFRMSDNV